MNTVADVAISAEARLIILRELAGQRDGRLNEIMLTGALDVYGIARSREWLRTQLNVLAELEAVRLDDVGSVRVATLRRAGRAHVDRGAILDGVARPADPD